VSLALPYARRTSALRRLLEHIALALAGRAGARLARRLGVTVSRSLLIRLIRALPDPEIGSLAVVGVDESLVGTVYGVLLYVVNFLVLSPLLFPVFGDANQPFELFAHVVFGTVLAFFFYGSGVRRSEGFVAIGPAQRAPAR
jgi:hypothetical protein